MEIGRDILRALAGPDSPWRVELLRAPLDGALGGFPDAPRGADPDRNSSEGLAAVFAGNVLNELSPARDETLEDRLGALMARIRRKLAPNGLFFAMEPGTRLGGKMVALARKDALADGFHVAAPCTHQGPCPMLNRPCRHSSSPPFAGWCHFAHPAAGAPAAWRELGAKARLEKYSLALSCLLLRRLPEDAPGRMVHSRFLDGLDELEALYEETLREDVLARRLPASPAGRQTPAAPSDGLAAENGLLRVISGPIRLPGIPEPGRYGCCAEGLGLLMDAARIPSGGTVLVRWPAVEKRDPKTGALMVERSAAHGGPGSGLRPKQPAPDGRPSPGDMARKPPKRRPAASSNPRRRQGKPS
jgi:hypothetical protein